MQSGRTNTILELVIAAFLAMTSGCMTPWSAPMTRTTTPRNSAAAASTPPAVRPPIPDPSKANAQSDMTGVLDKLEQVRALDPDAEPKLLEKLRQTPPDSWPLVAEQFRATLAYHEQLEAKEHAGSDESTAEARPASSVDVRQESRRLTSTPLVPPNLDSNHERPSTRIGALLDPHDASAESAPVFAQSTPAKTLNPTDMNPATMPVAKAPAEFAANGPTQPIRTSGQADVKQAAFQAPAEASGDTAQALAKIETGEAAARSSLPSASKGSSHISEADSSGSTDDESWQQLVRKAADDLSHRVASSPATTAEIHQHVSLRMLRLLAGDTEGALEPIPHISPAEQDYWSRQFFALATFLDHHSQPDDKRRAAAAVVHLDEAVSHLREMSSLSLRDLSFCKNVYGYGSFEPYDADIFSPGQQVSLYVEVENYHCTSTEKGYCTLLGATYELLDDKGTRLSGGEFPEVDDCCRSRRRDFHIRFGLTLPENLMPGRYRLELVVKDRQSDKLGHATAPFEIRSGRK